MLNVKILVILLIPRMRSDASAELKRSNRLHDDFAISTAIFLKTKTRSVIRISTVVSGMGIDLHTKRFCTEVCKTLEIGLVS